LFGGYLWSVREILSEGCWLIEIILVLALLLRAKLLLICVDFCLLESRDVTPFLVSCVYAWESSSSVFLNTGRYAISI
jgi:hypothetical protein